jgi:DNA-binding MarR family transcriptional regulator
MAKNTAVPSFSARQPGSRPPFVGALLRLAYQITREEQLKRLREHGFGDLNQALLNMMVYPHPDGVRPTDLAERTNMTRQATNYLLGQLEALGYVERRARKGSNRRLVFLTKRGWESVDIHRAAVLDVEARWAKALGQKRFDAFKETLAELVSLDAKRERTTDKDQ